MIMRRTLISGIATLLATASLTLSAYAQQSSTAFTYQGYLQDNNNPANGTYDLKFTLYDAATEGNAIGNPVFIEDLQISGGLFTVEVDFGTAPFAQGQRRWIEIAVRPGDSTDDHTTLDPRIELTPVPYALYAQNVANDAVSADQLANDPNALSKVSGGNLSITPDGYLKMNRLVYFRANRPKLYEQYTTFSKRYLPITMDNRGPGWYPISFGSILYNTGNVVTNNDIKPNSPNDIDSGAVFTAPVSGLYAVNFTAQVTSYATDPVWGGRIGVQIWDTTEWRILHSVVDEYGVGGTTANVISGVYYLPKDAKIRFVVYRGSNRGPEPTCNINGDYFDTTIYLLSAADEPSN